MNVYQWRSSARAAWLLATLARVVILIDEGPGPLSVGLLIVTGLIAAASWCVPVKPIKVTFTGRDGRTEGLL
jgi:hypothetical protein